MFPWSEAKFLRHETSDHMPILLSLGVEAKACPKPFKIFNYWTTLLGFRDVVRGRRKYTRVLCSSKLIESNVHTMIGSSTMAGPCKKKLKKACNDLEEWQQELGLREWRVGDLVKLKQKQIIVIQLLRR